MRRGGLYVVSVWDDLASNPVAETIHEAAVASFPDDPPQFFARTPHGHHHKAKLCADLAAAGFREITVDTVRLNASRMSAEELARGFCHGTPLRAEIEARDKDGLARVTKAAEQSLRRRFGVRRVESTIQAHLLRASC